MTLAIFTCGLCGIEQPKRHYKQKWCKACAQEGKRAHDRAYAAAHAELIRQRARQWRINNPGRRREADRRFREENADLVRERERQRYLQRGEAVRRRAAEWYARNRETVLERARSEEGRKAARERMQRRLQDDPKFKLHSNVSRAIRCMVGKKARTSWVEVLGYTAEDLRHHLERQFQKGMTWSNYGRGPGKWHIDHIVPRTAFAATSLADPELKACWALTNLRPMWGRDNISKHAKRTHLI